MVSPDSCVGSLLGLAMEQPRLQSRDLVIFLRHLFIQVVIHEATHSRNFACWSEHRCQSYRAEAIAPWMSAQHDIRVSSQLEEVQANVRMDEEHRVVAQATAPRTGTRRLDIHLRGGGLQFSTHPKSHAQ